MLICLDIVAILAEKMECQKLLGNRIFLSEPFADLLEVQKQQIKVILHKHKEPVTTLAVDAWVYEILGSLILSQQGFIRSFSFGAPD